jgi:hypothetical protein
MNIEKGYLAISIGEENKMFTLRSHSTHIDGWGNAVESSYHVTNLSTDPEQARNKARAIAKEREMPLNNTSWVSNSSLDAIDRKSKEELDALKADKEKRIARAKEISAKIELNYLYGSIPSLKDETINIGDVVQFDAKVEKPKDFDNTFYFFKRPTKARLLNQDQEVA